MFRVLSPALPLLTPDLEKVPQHHGKAYSSVRAAQWPPLLGDETAHKTHLLHHERPPPSPPSLPPRCGDSDISGAGGSERVNVDQMLPGHSLTALTALKVHTSSWEPWPRLLEPWRPVEALLPGRVGSGLAVCPQCPLPSGRLG